MKLLSSIAEYSDGFLTFITTICIQIIERGLASDQEFYLNFNQEWKLTLDIE